MRITMVAAHACVRMDKMALALQEKGHKIAGISRRTPTHIEAYDSLGSAFDIRQYLNAIKAYDSVTDVWHVHNEPSWYVQAIKEISNKPVVLDIHDSFLARFTPEEAEEQLNKTGKQFRIITEERNNFQLADGLVFPSQSFSDLVRNEYKLSQPNLTLPSYCTEEMQLYDTKEWLGGLVYEGRVDLDQDTEKQEMDCFNYCNYLKFAERAKELGIDFHVYAVREDQEFKKVYEDKVLLHPPKQYQHLIKYISRHDWGLVGNLFHTAEWKIALPNKLFEYLAAGVVPVVINAEEAARFVTENGVGIVISDLQELRDRWREHTEIRKHILKVRNKFVMNNHIGALEKLYEQLT